MDLKPIFKGYSINKLNMEKKSNNIKKTNYNINVDKYVNSSDKNLHKVIMTLNINSVDRNIMLELEGYFELINFNSQETNYFMNVTAPQILYPYARMIVSQLSSIDSEKNIVLPIINFAESKD